jgi:hypothetical protein
VIIFTGNMRMWLVKPEHMCRNHLLGEHLEIHMLVGCLIKGKSIKGYLENGLVDPCLIEKRHSELVLEMRSRGYKHYSPIEHLPGYLPKGNIDSERNTIELATRCAKCKALKR